MEWIGPKAKTDERCEHCVYNLQGNCIMPTLRDVSLRFVLCAPEYDVIEDAEEVAAAAWYGWQYEEERPSPRNDLIILLIVNLGSLMALMILGWAIIQFGSMLWTTRGF